MSLNRGDDFAGQVGLLGVTSDPRDVGLPADLDAAASTARWAIPPSFMTRDNQHFELYDNVTIDRGAHRLKFGGYYFHLQLRPEQPDNARGAFTYTGQFTATRSPISCSATRRRRPRASAAATRTAGPTGCMLYAQDDWRARDNLTFNLGLRYEYNQHMYDVDNRLSSIDLSAPGGRFVIASDEHGTHRSRRAGAAAAACRFPYVTSADRRAGAAGCSTRAPCGWRRASASR